MTTEKMTVHKALAELKVLEDRVLKAVGDGVYCVSNKHSNGKIGGIPLDDYLKVMQGSYDKASDLIRRTDALKRAVVLSNAKTTVTIGDREYTVAEAIWMKNSGIDLRQELLDQMRTQYLAAQSVILSKNGKELEERAEKYVIGLYGSKEGKTSVEEFEKVKKTFIENETYELVDPIGVLNKIETLEKEIDTFKAEVDAALSVSNAITEITIEY